MSAVLHSIGDASETYLLRHDGTPRSSLQASPETVWPFVEAGCVAAEIAVWFGLSIEGAKWLAWSAKRKHLVAA